jgi:phospholipid/cholesterol/gamma-HCH transport system permease protein
MSKNNPLSRAVGRLGNLADQRIRRTSAIVENIGGMAALLVDIVRTAARALTHPKIKLGRPALAEQMVRIGVDSIGIVVMVQVFIGCILALQLAPTLAEYGQLDQVATVVAIAVVRELGPLITAVVLSGFAGASIAAEIGAMVEAEEIKALRAHALNPIHFLILPRTLATVIMIVGLAVVADFVGVLGGLLTAWTALDIEPRSYAALTLQALEVQGFLTGLFKAGVFGLLISLIACYEGLNVRGGAVGVGRATTRTVVRSIVAIIGADALFVTVFYVYGW